MSTLNQLGKAIFLSMCCTSSVVASTNSINTGGVTYSIAEQDALEEIQERAESAKVSEFIAKKERSDWSVWRGHPLPVSTANHERHFVPWYVLERDIPGPNGQILYPKGFTFNPLSHIRLPQRVVVFKLDQYNRIKKYLKPSDILIADSGDVVEASSEWGIHINILSAQVAKRFGVQRVPSFVEQQGMQLRIREININVE